ncbi:Hypothetical predicted protein [Olea europaea subsp. europaea]|uniref:Uncharacterized protein n=1 Tax=Olea europaea subsp. europaea TaxID=158383 RepID=A0A8S0TNF3_OLEEU|nr:Hypothetical predicted protein [Olea europaea subsp. europaea]
MDLYSQNLKELQENYGKAVFKLTALNLVSDTCPDFGAGSVGVIAVHLRQFLVHWVSCLLQLVHGPLSCDQCISVVFLGCDWGLIRLYTPSSIWVQIRSWVVHGVRTEAGLNLCLVVFLRLVLAFVISTVRS